MTKELNERGRQLRAQALFSRGTELLQKQQPEQALGLLQQAHKLDPENRDLTLNLSGAYILTRKFKQAVPLLEKLLEDISFNAPDLEEKSVTIDRAYVQDRLKNIIENEDLSRYIL